MAARVCPAVTVSPMSTSRVSRRPETRKPTLVLVREAMVPLPSAARRSGAGTASITRAVRGGGGGVSSGLQAESEERSGDRGDGAQKLQGHEAPQQPTCGCRGLENGTPDETDRPRHRPDVHAPKSVAFSMTEQMASGQGGRPPPYSRHARKNRAQAHRSRRPRLPGGRLLLRLPGLFPVHKPGRQIQLPLRRLADRRDPAVLDQALPVHPRRRGRHQADPSRHPLRQVRGHVPEGDLRRLQGHPPRPAGRPQAAIPADARGGARLRPRADREGGLRGRRPHRHLCQGGRGGRAPRC